MKTNSQFFKQLLPSVLSITVFGLLTGILFLLIKTLNLLPVKAGIALNLRFEDILVGAFIYFKTSVDFAMLIGLLMKSNHGWKNRVAIELGTALGNGLGTFLVLIFWIIFKNLHFLLAIMILISSLVLLELAESGLRHFVIWKFTPGIKRKLYHTISLSLQFLLRYTRPVLSKVVPNFSKNINGSKRMSWKGLVAFSVTTPFLLGLDDFAAYIPIFSVINVYGFAVGVLAAHTILNLGMFSFPESTVKIFQNRWISFVGTLVFIILALWGIFEALRIIF